MWSLCLTSCLSRQIIGNTSHENPRTEASLSPPTGKRQDKLGIEMDGKLERLQAYFHYDLFVSWLIIVLELRTHNQLHA